MTTHTGLLWKLPLTVEAPARYLAHFAKMPTIARGKVKPDNLHLLRFVPDDTITPGHVLLTAEEPDNDTKRIA
jgi:hypothetical protein